MTKARRHESASRTVRRTTLLELVQRVQDHAASDAEVVAVITRLINSRQVVLRGIFAGCQIVTA